MANPRVPAAPAAPFDFVATSKAIKADIDHLNASDNTRYLPSEIKFIDTPYAKDFKKFKDDIAGKLSTVGIAHADQLSISAELEKIEDGLQAEYKKCLKVGGTVLEQKAWQDNFTGLN